MTDWHAAYRDRYARLKREGVPFFPDVLFKDAVVALLVFAALCALALVKGAALEDLADPADSTYNPRPEWYFLFLFQALKFFPGRLEPVAAVVLPAAAVAVLVLLPFLDRGAARHPLDRPLTTGLSVAALAGMAWLTWAGARSPLLNPLTERDPLVQEGRRLYLELRCAYCHAIDGKGGWVGPDLATAAGSATREFLVRHFRNPQTTSPESVMPAMGLLDEEVQPLVAYVLSLGGGGEFTKEAPRIFGETCATCHKFGGEGGEVGPDLTAVGQLREKAYLRRYVTDPGSLNPSATMPGFKGQLTDVQIEDLCRYLTARRGAVRITEGRRIYERFKCALCHAIRGRGGQVGPDLVGVAARRNASWLRAHLLKPREVVPGTAMPQFTFVPGEPEALVDYLQSLGGKLSYTADAPVLFKANCMKCHRLTGHEKTTGPNLGSIGLRRDVGWLATYLADPASIHPKTVMPSFKGKLTEAQIEDLGRYLVAQRRPETAP